MICVKCQYLKALHCPAQPTAPHNQHYDHAAIASNLPGQYAQGVMSQVASVLEVPPLAAEFSHCQSTAVAHDVLTGGQSPLLHAITPVLLRQLAGCYALL